MAKPEIVSEVRINGVWYKQEELDPEEFHTMLGKKFDEVMGRYGFKRKETA